MTSNESTAPVELDKSEINHIIRALLSDVEGICDELFTVSHRLGDAGALERDEAIGEIERIVSTGTELRTPIDIINKMYQGRLALRDEDRGTRIKAMASRVRKAQGEQETTSG